MKREPIELAILSVVAQVFGAILFIVGLICLPIAGDHLIKVIGMILGGLVLSIGGRLQGTKALRQLREEQRLVEFTADASRSLHERAFVSVTDDTTLIMDNHAVERDDPTEGNPPAL